MIAAVTGVGPRVGTSFVMRQAKMAGLPVMGEPHPPATVKEFNPEGYYDLDIFKIHRLVTKNLLDGHVVKVWNTLLPHVGHNVNHMVLIERKDKAAQMRSARAVFAAEMELEICQGLEFDFEDIWFNLQPNVAELKDKYNVMHVYTEELNTQIGDIIRFLERGLLCR